MKNNIILMLISLIALPAIGYSVVNEASKRAPCWRRTYNKFDETVSQGKCRVKLTADNKSMVILYMALSEERKGYDTLKVLSKGSSVIVELDTGDYLFSVNGFGNKLNSCLNRVTLKNQYYYEAQIHLYKKYTRAPVSVMGKVKKPAIYLYSPKSVTFNLSIQPKGHFTYTYPEHGVDGWTVSVSPNAALKVDGKPFDYLFWEGEQEGYQVEASSGFCVAQTEVVPFLEEQLSGMGLNAKEQNDFIAYWGPILSKNKYNYVHFLTGKSYDELIGAYSSDITFDNELRVFMEFKPLEHPISVMPQIFEKVTREGLLLIEWGGGELPDGMLDL